MNFYTIDDIRRVYDQLDIATGVDTSGVAIEFSSRMTRLHGYCRYKNRKPVKISIAEFLRTNQDEFWDTVLHEYAHAVVKIRYPNEKHGHDAIWKGVCIEIGCRPERLGKITEEQRAVMDERVKYRVTCSDCGRYWNHYRETKCVKELKKRPDSDRFFCPTCRTHALQLQILR